MKYTREQSTISPSGIFYPDTDGKPAAEGDFQLFPLFYAINALDIHFQEQPDVYVSGNLLVYYQEGHPSQVVAPDVFVVFGVPKYPRWNYKVWEEGKGPDVVIEITSADTQQEDEADKPRVYRQLQVQEYFQYDPTEDYLSPPLKGRRLNAHGEYTPIAATQQADGILCLQSQVLGLELHLKEGELRLFDPINGSHLLTFEEEVEARQQAQAARQHAERKHIEARIKALEAELECLRAEREKQSGILYPTRLCTEKQPSDFDTNRITQ